MKSILISILLLFHFSSVCFCQEKTKNHLPKLGFTFSGSEISDSSQLIIEVIYSNNTNDSLDIYQYLEEGYRGDRFYNFNIELQKWNGEEYLDHVKRYYNNPLIYNMEDSLRHFDLPQKKLPPLTSDTLRYNLMRLGGDFPKGKYRFKAHLRVKTLRDDRPYNDKNFESLPPQDEIVYESSKWFYFKVTRDLQKKRKKVNYKYSSTTAALYHLVNSKERDR